MLTDLRSFDLDRILALNNAHAVETSFLDAPRLSAMLREVFHAIAVDSLEALLIAFDQDARYDSVNFQWFRARRQRFVYVDRIITSAPARGRGHARRLYEDLFVRSLAAGHDVVVCEVNLDPPNPGSDAFHAALGFAECGRAILADTGKTVRYLERRLV